MNSPLVEKLYLEVAMSKYVGSFKSACEMLLSTFYIYLIFSLWCQHFMIAIVIVRFQPTVPVTVASRIWVTLPQKFVSKYLKFSKFMN